MGIEGIELDEISAPNFYAPNDAPLTDAEKDQLNRIKEVSAPPIASLGRKGVEIGMSVEKIMNSRINGYIQEASNYQKTIDLLVDLNGKLAFNSETENEKPVTAEILEICKSLKEKGIDILQDAKSFTRERLAEIKANVSAHTDRLKTNLQVLFTTKIQVSIQEVQSIMDCSKKIEEASRSTGIIRNMKNGGG